MVTSISPIVPGCTRGFSVFDQLSYSNPALPLGAILSAKRVRERFAASDGLFGSGENDCWDTGVTLWSFIGQLLQDGKQRS